MPVTEKIIQLDQFCKPSESQKSVPLGKEERDVRWTRPDGGAVVLVTVKNPGIFFGNGRQDGNDFVIRYNGSSRPPLRTWEYEPQCRENAPLEEPPQMTNGPG